MCLICLACTFHMVHHFILCNFTLHHPRNTLHAGNYLCWTWDNFLRFCVRVCAWEEVRIIWWDLWFFSLAVAYNHFLSDTTILGYFICSPFCSSLISVGRGHFIFFMGNKHDIYSVLLHGHNLLSCPSFWKDNSHSEKDDLLIQLPNERKISVWLPMWDASDTP